MAFPISIERAWMAAARARRYDGHPDRRPDALPEPEGPWSLPPAAPAAPAQTTRARRNLRGLALWLGLIALGGAVFFGLAALFPQQLNRMDQFEAMRLLGLLALVSSGLVYARRVRFGEAARNIGIWLGLAALILVGYSFRGELAGAFTRVRGELIPAMAVPAGDHAMTITASDDGGFYVMGQVNGASVKFAIDTDSLAYASPSETANGVGLMAPVTLSNLDVGQIKLTGVAAEVDKAPMSTSLLGMAFLRRLDSFEVKGDQLTLRWKG